MTIQAKTHPVTGKLWFNSLYAKNRRRWRGLYPRPAILNYWRTSFYFFQVKSMLQQPPWVRRKHCCWVWRNRGRDSAPTSGFPIQCLGYFRLMSRVQLYLLQVSATLQCYPHLPQLRGLANTWLAWTNNSFQRRNFESLKSPTVWHEVWDIWAQKWN